MNDNETAAPNEFLGDMAAFQQQLVRKFKVAGLSKRLIDDKISIQLSRSSPFDTATVNFTFKAGHGMEHLLTTIVTSDAIDTPERREEVADSFVPYMNQKIAQAQNSAESRRAIAAAAAEVIAEAKAEGIELELLRLESAPVHVFGKPDEENAQVFYVHVNMPHLDGSTMTRDCYTIDADDAEEFADYMRNYTLPELRELLRTHAAGHLAA